LQEGNRPRHNNYRCASRNYPVAELRGAKNGNGDDTGIYGYGADGIVGSTGTTTLGQGDDVLLMILEDWSGTLAISHFDIV